MHCKSELDPIAEDLAISTISYQLIRILCYGIILFTVFDCKNDFATVMTVL